jgi:hypothetical protein
MDPDLDPKRRQSIDKTVAIPINHENPNHRNIFNSNSQLEKVSSVHGAME